MNDNQHRINRGMVLVLFSFALSWANDTFNKTGKDYEEWDTLTMCVCIVGVTLLIVAWIRSL